jgi:peptidoglycan/LPS O-acetylase OafA/YrhL
MSGEGDNHPKQSRIWIAFAVFAAVIGALLLYEHRIHVFTGDALLIGLLAACIGVHLFMHGGHGGHDSHRGDKE